MGSDIESAIRPTFVMLVLFALLLCGAYPLAVLGIGQAVFPAQANGSLIRDGDKVVGSSLIGQGFSSDRYFWPRPSAAGKGFPGTSNAIYAASKGAVISLTKTAAQQLGPHNINVNAVCPGIVRTALYEDIVKVMAKTENMSIEAVEARAVASVPLRRANEPEDIADMVVFLASPRARNITGQSYNVDGGLIPD